MNTMKIRKTASGFTLTELVLAVAILTILLGLATVNVVRYLRTLTQLERDGIAREIFVAAQNHLTMAESQGFLGADDSADSYTENGKTFYYLVSRNSGESEEEADLLGDEDEEE
ncbi:MAG: type II secretion system protein, partial [Oscillibacter sp.]|nr:type II secretion system protein [Oscillibacter sp.]